MWPCWHPMLGMVRKRFICCQGIQSSVVLGASVVKNPPMIPVLVTGNMTLLPWIFKQNASFTCFKGQKWCRK